MILHLLHYIDMKDQLEFMMEQMRFISQELQKKYKLLQLDFWTTVSCLNIKNLPDIINFAKNKNIPHEVPAASDHGCGMVFIRKPCMAIRVITSRVPTMQASRRSLMMLPFDSAARDIAADSRLLRRRQDCKPCCTPRRGRPLCLPIAPFHD